MLIDKLLEQIAIDMNKLQFYVLFSATVKSSGTVINISFVSPQVKLNIFFIFYIMITCNIRGG